MPDHKGFKLQQLINVQKFSTLRVNTFCKLTKLLCSETMITASKINDSRKMSHVYQSPYTFDPRQRTFYHAHCIINKWRDMYR